MSATNASDPSGDTAPIPAVATKEEIGEANAKLLKLQQDLLALHEKILGIREKDLYDVRHTVDGLAGAVPGEFRIFGSRGNAPRCAGPPWPA